MKKIVRKIQLAVILAACVMLCGCGDKEQTSQKTETETSQKASANEDYFEWSDNIIVGLTSEGKKQKVLVIPERCEGFNCQPFAEEDVKVKEVSFESDKDIPLGYVFGYSKTIEKITLPKELTKIGDLEFHICEALKEIVIPDAVESIGAYAFQYCTSLEKVVLGANTTSIEMNAFEKCSALKTVEFSEKLTTIKTLAFYECMALETVKFPETISEIGGMAFMNSGVTDVYFPAGVELSNIDTTSFVQVTHSVNIHIGEGSWMDENFETFFSGPYVKCYE